MRKKNLITGAFSYSGKYIAARLLDMNEEIVTLTSKTPPLSASRSIEAIPYCFDDFGRLVEILKSVSTVYNTYWVRFNYGSRTYDFAVKNTKTLIRASVEAGVERFVHVSITNPSPDSSLPYFRGKAELEKTLKESGLSYAILRPTVLFGNEDILVNNVAWLLRHFPVFGMVGDGEYKFQPVYVDDLAELAVRVGREKTNTTMDAIGPETFSFMEFVSLVKKTIGSRALIVPMNPRLALFFARLIGRLTGDVVLTRDEVEGLASGLLVSSATPTCSTKFTDWARENCVTLGTRYASEIERHYK